jgi:hypothetical protein
MSDIAKTMADRIRERAGGTSGFLAPTGKVARSHDQVVAEQRSVPTTHSLLRKPMSTTDGNGALVKREAYIVEVAEQFKQQYGVALNSVTALFVPRNDMVYAAAEQNMPKGDFIKTIGSQMAFETIVGKEPEFARYVTGENEVKLALAEYSYAVGDWTFTDGYAVTDLEGNTIVVAPAFNETTSAWQFSAFNAPCGKDAFVAMSRAEKAAMPTEERVYGDIDDCVKAMYVQELAPAARGMQF